MNQFRISTGAYRLEDSLEDSAGRCASETRRPSVALVAHDVHDSSGTGRVCYELVQCLADRVRFIVVSATLAEDLRPLVESWIRIRVPRKPIPLRFVLFYVTAALSLRRQRVDLIHTVGAIVPNRVDLASIHFCHAGYLATTHRLSATGTPTARRINTGLSRLLALGAERWGYRPHRMRAFAAVSEHVARELDRHYPRIPYAITPNGVDLHQFFPEAVTREHLRSSEQLGEDLVALFVGGNWDLKGLGVAIQALALARAQGLSMRLWVVGSGHQQRFRQTAKDLGVGEVVKFWGPQSNISRYYQAADLFLLPSLYETFSLVALEAAASGLPLVVTPSIGIGSEIVGAGEGGRVVSRDPELIAAAILELGRDGALRRRLGEQALQRAGQFTWQRCAETTLELYKSLLPLD